MNKLPEDLKVLYNAYLGENAWNVFVSGLRSACVNPNDLLDLTIPEDIAKVILSKVGPIEHTRRWLVLPVPALSNYNPLDILKNYEEGEIILRSVLMRMP
ncbi:hypothetical protein [Photobacterium sp. 53610]|uniref:hypothetical protein n=1 Tax=Photobacterium sp. 53610 TaxID=3102789 RepID=UPI002EDBA5A0